MPELPEVETIKRTLAPHIRGKAFQRIQSITPSLLRGPTAQEVAKDLPGRVIAKLGRRGKYLLVYLTYDKLLVFHLGMSGRITYCSGPGATPLEPHTHFWAQLGPAGASGEDSRGDSDPGGRPGGELRLVDPRRFGKIYYGDEMLLTGKLEAKLGWEPFDPRLTAETLKPKLGRSRRPIKTALLDQGLIAGIGNIYADEALFAAGIHPARTAESLALEAVENLLQSLRQVLVWGIEDGGTTFRDYVNGRGERGSHQDHLSVYGREGQPCPRCQAPVERIRIGGRSSFCCPRCQVAPS